MSSVALEPLLRPTPRPTTNHKIHTKLGKPRPISIHFSHKSIKFGWSLCSLVKPSQVPSLTSCSATSTTVSGNETAESTDIVYSETFPLRRIELVEGKIYIRLDQGEKGDILVLTVGCTLPGKWVLHWGVNYLGQSGREWDQPPVEMRPSGSVGIKDYAIETPMTKLDVPGAESIYEVKIDFSKKGKIGAVNFVLKDEETGSWYQRKSQDFKVPLIDYLQYGDTIVGETKSPSLWTGAMGRFSNVLASEEQPQPKTKASTKGSAAANPPNRPPRGIYDEQRVVKEVPYENSVSVFVRKCPETAKNLVSMETDLSGEVVVHWGACRDTMRAWEIPAAPYPPDTEVFKNKALRTRLQPKKDGNGLRGVFTLDQGLAGFSFVLKFNEDTWLDFMGKDFFIPFSNPSSPAVRSQGGLHENEAMKDTPASKSSSVDVLEGENKQNDEDSPVYTDGIIKEIRSLVTDISSEKKWKTKSKEAQESILQEIEKLAAEAYSIFRTSVPTFAEEEAEVEQREVKISSGTGSGYEILCQGFNWESHRSGGWYRELNEKAAELSSLGFTIIWLPPPTESVSPEGYMPKDLYNLNSRYGTIDELKTVVKKFHQVGLKVLGDVVLNHRCAHYQNKNGVWNIFGGRLNWDDRAVVADDPHFQGRGNKSSGDSFHAAPNIDHSQDFVRKDIAEWMCWLRKDIGYDGWRLDFVRGFWGGYVKEYLDATEPYFVVGEYWDSLSYTYNEMDYNQDAHRQRIIDWMNATGGTAGAFDVTTKGILHCALDRCEYWRLSDPKGKPPGVVGWWPSRAVTFIENHDTGSTQGHWRFPGSKEMQGYAYILTHPGTPAVFYDHIFSHYKHELSALISIRNRNKIHCRSTVKIVKAEKEVYAAIVDDKVAMKIGPGHYEPSNGSKNWSLAAEGKEYKVWEAS